MTKKFHFSFVLFLSILTALLCLPALGMTSLDTLLMSQASASQVLSMGPTHRIQKIVVDAGHGGKDPGALSPWGLVEKEVALDVAQRLSRILRAEGVEVIMTRDRDRFIPLAKRAHVANKKRADLFVSIHANASTNKSVRGFEVYTLSNATDDMALAVERAENSVLRLESAHGSELTSDLKAILWDMYETENRRESVSLARAVADSAAESVSVAAKSARSANFYVLKWTECPAVLVEIGYLTHIEDQKKLKSTIYREKLAQAIARAVMNYKKEFEYTDGYTR